MAGTLVEIPAGHRRAIRFFYFMAEYMKNPSNGEHMPDRLQEGGLPDRRPAG